MIVQLMISLKLFAFDGGILGFIFKNSLSSGVFAMLGGLVIVPIISLFTQKHKPDEAEKLFECYKVTHTVPAKSSLSED